MNLPQGTLLKHGEYRIERGLGQGGFGITYLAVQVGLNRRVTIKEFFMSDYCNRDAETSHVTAPSEGSKVLVAKFRNKFIKEAQSIASMKHPNIINIYDVFEENGTAYYVMEYLDHGSLADVVKRQGRLSEADALSYIRQIADALSYIHARKMSHLDVKPDNILINEYNAAVLIDFGISKHYDNEDKQTSTTPVGISHGYAPLEQYKKGGVGTFSPATDIYSLGATLYKLITGTTPPDANDINDDGLPPLPSYVSVFTAKAIKQAMQPRRKDRPQSIEELLALLNASAEEAIDVVVTPEEDENTVPLGEQKPKPVNNTSFLGMLLRKPIDAIEACIAAAYVDRPVGLWALVSVALLLVSCFVDIYGSLIINLPGHSYDEYLIFPSILLTIAYIVSSTLMFAKMGKSRNKLSSKCLYVWACLMLFVYIYGTFVMKLPWWKIPSDILVDALFYISCSLNITNIIAQVSLIAFLVLRFKKTSTYKLPLMVGIAGVVVRLVNILTCCCDYGIFSYGSIPQVGWHLLPLIIYWAHVLLMVASFILMFFASRKLEKKRVGQC